MKKLSMSLIAVAFLMVSCNNSQKTKTSSKKKEQSVLSAVKEKVTTVTVANFKEKAGELVGKKVTIEGTVDHVCKHGGQKMMLIDQNTENRVKITPNEKVAAFKPELEGEDVEVTGVVDEMKIDENYLNEWEDEVKEGIEKKEKKGLHEGKEESKKHADSKNKKENNEQGQALQQIENLRKKLKESAKDHLSFYSIVCSEYEVVKPAEKDK